MIDKKEVLKIIRRFYKDRNLNIDECNFVHINPDISIQIEDNCICLFENGFLDQTFKNIVEFKHFYNCLTMKDVKKYLVEEKGFISDALDYISLKYKNTTLLITTTNELYIGKELILNKKPINIYYIIKYILE